MAADRRAYRGRGLELGTADLGPYPSTVAKQVVGQTAAVRSAEIRALVAHATRVTDFRAIRRSRRVDANDELTWVVQQDRARRGHRGASVSAFAWTLGIRSDPPRADCDVLVD